MEDKIHQKTDELCGNIDKTVTIIKRDIKEIKEYILARLQVRSEGGLYASYSNVSDRK